MPNTMKNSKKLLTADANNMLPLTLPSFSVATLFYQVFHDFLIWYLGCTCTFFSSSMSAEIVTFTCFVPNNCENVANTVIWLVFLNIINSVRLK